MQCMRAKQREHCEEEIATSHSAVERVMSQPRSPPRKEHGYAEGVLPRISHVLQ